MLYTVAEKLIGALGAVAAAPTARADIRDPEKHAGSAEACRHYCDTT